MSVAGSGLREVGVGLVLCHFGDGTRPVSPQNTWKNRLFCLYENLFPHRFSPSHVQHSPAGRARRDARPSTPRESDRVYWSAKDAGMETAGSKTDWQGTFAVRCHPGGAPFTRAGACEKTKAPESGLLRLSRGSGRRDLNLNQSESAVLTPEAGKRPTWHNKLTVQPVCPPRVFRFSMESRVSCR